MFARLFEGTAMRFRAGPHKVSRVRKVPDPLRRIVAVGRREIFFISLTFIFVLFTDQHKVACLLRGVLLQNTGQN